MGKKVSKTEEKKEIEKGLNELLETDIKWSRLSYENLQELVFIFSNSDVLAKKLDIRQKFPILEGVKERFSDLMDYKPFINEVRKKFLYTSEK